MSFNPFQSSFQPGYSTNTALADDLRRDVDSGSASLLVLLNLRTVSDTIHHGIPMERLSDLGVGGTVLRWVCSFLSERSPKVVPWY